MCWSADLERLCRRILDRLSQMDDQERARMAPRAAEALRRALGEVSPECPRQSEECASEGMPDEVMED